MKYLKYSLLLAVVATMSSCLKERSSITEIYDDKGTIVTTFSETAYINTFSSAIQGETYDHTVANFNFSTRPNEAVKFFTLKISQPRENKLTGPLTVRVTTADYGGTLYPVGAITILTPPTGAINVTDIVVPQTNDDLIVIPVKFTVNKTLLDPAELYGVRFTFTTTSQGVFNALEKNVDVLFNYSDFSVNTNNSDYEANYTYHSEVVDPVNQFGITNNNTRYLIEAAPNALEYQDLYYYALQGALFQNLIVYNFATGASTSLFKPRYVLNTSGQVTAVQNMAGAAVTNLALDPAGPNRFVYTSNNERSLEVRYTFTLTTTINGVVTPRTVRAYERFTYDPNQVYP